MSVSLFFNDSYRNLSLQSCFLILSNLSFLGFVLKATVIYKTTRRFDKVRSNFVSSNSCNCQQKQAKLTKLIVLGGRGAHDPGKDFEEWDADAAVKGEVRMLCTELGASWHGGGSSLAPFAERLDELKGRCPFLSFAWSLWEDNRHLGLIIPPPFFFFVGT